MSSLNKAWKIAASLGKLPVTDHRVIGSKQSLFFFHEFSPGSLFLLPRGLHIYDKLVQFIRNENKLSGYLEVNSPAIYSSILWQESGHWQYYRDNMIHVEDADGQKSLKPMSCPAHCLIFKEMQQSSFPCEYPIRLSEFGTIHRRELSGSLTGLTRLSRFTQDDGHIFCHQNQIKQEVFACLEMARRVYKKFDLNFEAKLSKRPHSYLGDSASWNLAEDFLRKALNEASLTWEELDFEGAFYGPKIDLFVRDNQDRAQQCATIQLDFLLPEQFKLSLKIGSESVQPVIIHRAILGSVERFMAMLCEETRGRWPFWMSPFQAKVISVHSKFNPYAQKVHRLLQEAGFWTDCDLSGNRLPGIIRAAQMMPYQLVLVVGQRESENETVNCRICIEPQDINSLLSPQTIGGEELVEKVGVDKIGKDDGYIVRNVAMPLAKLIELMHEFERFQVNRADLRLLQLFTK